MIRGSEGILAAQSSSAEDGFAGTKKASWARQELLYGRTMHENLISPQLAALLLKKLDTESIPIVAFLVCGQALHARILGFVGSVTDSHDIVIAGKKGQSEESASIRVQMPEAKFRYADKREYDENPRYQGVTRYGEARLVAELPSGSSLTITFTL